MVEASAPDERPVPHGTAQPALVAVTELLRELSFAVARHHHWLAGQLGLHATDLSALMVVHDLTTPDGVGPPIGRVGEQLGLSSPATTALVDRLVAAGHLERTPDADDRRRVLLRATDRSYDAIGPLLGDHLRRLDEALSTFGADDLAAAHRFLATVLGELRATLDGAPPPPAGRSG